MGAVSRETGGELILHIGTHKTGSTSLQEWAYEHRESLALEAGLEIYRGRFGTNHVEIPLICLRASRNMPARSRLPDWCLEGWQDYTRRHVRSQIKGPAPSLFVSAEALSYLRHQDELGRLTRLLAPRRVTVVVVLRERTAFLRSYRSQMNAMGFPPSPYPKSFAYVEPDTWLTDYDALLAAYRLAFGEDRVMSVDYEGALERYGTVIPAVMAAAGVPLAQLPPWSDAWLNRSPANA